MESYNRGFIHGAATVLGILLLLAGMLALSVYVTDRGDDVIAQQRSQDSLQKEQEDLQNEKDFESCEDLAYETRKASAGGPFVSSPHFWPSSPDDSCEYEAWFNWNDVPWLFNEDSINLLDSTVSALETGECSPPVNIEGVELSYDWSSLHDIEVKIDIPMEKIQNVDIAAYVTEILVNGELLFPVDSCA